MVKGVSVFEESQVISRLPRCSSIRFNLRHRRRIGHRGAALTRPWVVPDPVPDPALPPPEDRPASAPHRTRREQRLRPRGRYGRLVRRAARPRGGRRGRTRRRHPHRDRRPAGNANVAW